MIKNTTIILYTYYVYYLQRVIKKEQKKSQPHLCFYSRVIPNLIKISIIWDSIQVFPRSYKIRAARGTLTRRAKQRKNLQVRVDAMTIFTIKFGTFQNEKFRRLLNGHQKSTRNYKFTVLLEVFHREFYAESMIS